jgi:hypothetical protein
MIKLKPLIICETTINRVENISNDDIKVGESGYEYLKNAIAEINKKATKWGLPPVTLDVIKEEMVSVKKEDRTEFKKIFTLKVEGSSPQITGYEFIAKIEHTDAGNLINISPNSSIKNLPDEYRNADAICDVCKSKRERNNTFIIRDDKTNELLTVGSSCLKRFLPIDSVNKVINFAEILEKLRELIEEKNGDFDEGAFSGGGQNYFTIEELLMCLAQAYLSTGKFISKKKANEYYEETGSTIESTVGLASNILYTRPTGNKIPAFIVRAREVAEKAKELVHQILEWGKSHDFEQDAKNKPEMANYFNNLAVIVKQNHLKSKSLGYLSGLLASYLIEQNQIKKREEKANAPQSEFVGQIGEKITFDATVKFQRQFSGQYGITTLVSLEDDKGNKYTWFASGTPSLEDGKTYRFKATVKNHQVSKYGGHNETVITRAKITDL